MRELIETAEDARIDYIALVDPDTLQPVETITGRTLAALAVKIENTRLIDNCLLEPKLSGEWCGDNGKSFDSLPVTRHPLTHCHYYVPNLVLHSRASSPASRCLGLACCWPCGPWRASACWRGWRGGKASTPIRGATCPSCC